MIIYCKVIKAYNYSKFPIQLFAIPIFILSISVFLLASNSYCLTSEEIKNLREKGYSTKEIREIIESQKEGKDNINAKQADAINLLKRNLHFILFMDRTGADFRLSGYEIKFFHDYILQESEWFHHVNTNDRYKLKTKVYFKNIKNIEIIPYTIEDSTLPGLLSYLSTTKRTAYFIKIKTRKLKYLKAYVKEPYCFDRYHIEKIKNAFEILYD